MKNVFHPAPVLLAGAIVGFAIASPLICYGLLTFESTITVGNIVQGAATILTGLIVAFYIQWNTQADRKEKDILLGRLDVVLTEVAELDKFKDGGEYTQVVASLKRLAMACGRFCNLADFSQYPATVVNRSGFDAGIKKLRRLMSDIPINAIEQEVRQSGMSASVKDGIIRWANDRKTGLELELQKFLDLTLKTQIELNRARTKS